MVRKIIVMLLFAVSLSAQVTYMEEAPEKWSKPVLVEIIYTYAQNLRTPYVRADGQQLVFDGRGLSTTFLSDTGWTYPYSFPENINKNLAEDPVISPDGKRMFFTWYTSTWQVYYSDWDEQLQEWGTAVNAGEAVNGIVGGASAGCAPDDTTFCFFLGGTLYFARWDSSQGKYVDGKKFPDGSVGTVASWWGGDMTSDFENVYMCHSLSDTTLTGSSYHDRDIVVGYRDTAQGYIIYDYYKLNISNQADTLYFSGEYINRYEASPTVTGDGRHLYFLGNYHGYYAIYHSRLLQDRYGNPVTKVEEKYKLKEKPKEKVNMHPVYPNPSNNQFSFTFDLKEPGETKIIIYNIMGEKIYEEKEKYLREGSYRNSIILDKESSGVYLLNLILNKQSFSTKFILVK